MNLGEKKIPQHIFPGSWLSYLINHALPTLSRNASPKPLDPSKLRS